MSRSRRPTGDHRLFALGMVSDGVAQVLHVPASVDGSLTTWALRPDSRTLQG